MSKIIVVGESGTIGRAVADLLGQTHQVIRVGNRHGDYTVDLSSKASIENVFNKIGSIDAAISAAGLSRFGKLGEASDDDFMFSINNKLMGQVNLVWIAQQHVSPNGSIPLTTGLLAREPWPGTVPTAMVNAALEGFVRAAALDASNGIRINAVSPIFVTETATKMSMDKAGTMSAIETAKAYQSCLAGGYDRSNSRCSGLW
ncbi:MAG: short chain dehydrogenase [Desulfobacterales bacterium]